MEYNIQGDSVVRLRPSADEPTTEVGRIAVDLLRREGSMPFHLLVERVASEMHRCAVKEGGWMLDLGLFAGHLFAPLVLSEIKAGDGMFWQIG